MRKSLLCLSIILVAAAAPASAIENGFYLGGSIGGSSLEVQIGLKGWDAFAVGLLPLGPVDLFAKVGVVSWDADIVAVLDDLIDSESESGTDAAYGIGVALRLGKVALRAEGEQFNIADAEDVYMFSVGAAFTF